MNLIGKTLSVLGVAISMLEPPSLSGQEHRVSVRGDVILFDQQETKILGLRCSNALMSDQTTEDLIDAFDLYREYGLNTVSVFLMGSRFGDVKGFLPDGSLNPLYRDRLERIIRAANQRAMIVIVGCLYWSTSKAKEELSHWTQIDADRAIANTATWLKKLDFHNVILDPDNEGMAVRAKGWKIESMIQAAKRANATLVVANNTKQSPPNEDLNMHFGKPEQGKPWFDSEASPKNVPGGYWGTYSKETVRQHPDFYNYSRIGRHTAEMKANIFKRTIEETEQYNGFVLTSTWLQCRPIEGIGGPFSKPGGRSNLGAFADEGAPWNTEIDTLHPDAGILWWLEFVKERLGTTQQLNQSHSE